MLCCEMQRGSDTNFVLLESTARHTFVTWVEGMGINCFKISIATTIAFAVNSFKELIRDVSTFSNIDKLLNLMHFVDHRSKW